MPQTAFILANGNKAMDEINTTGKLGIVRWFYCISREDLLIEAPKRRAISDLDHILQWSDIQLTEELIEEGFVREIIVASNYA